MQNHHFDAKIIILNVILLRNSRVFLCRAEGVARLNLPTRLRYAHDAAKGLIFLHSRKVIHCDLKTSNLLVANDASKTVKLCDFSMSRIGGGAKPWLRRKTASGRDLNANQSKDLNSDGAEAGTPGFISPEEMMGAVQH